MAKSYHLKEIIEQELNRKLQQTNRAEKKHSRFSNERRRFDETAIWQAAVQLEASGREFFD